MTLYLLCGLRHGCRVCEPNNGFLITISSIYYLLFVHLYLDFQSEIHGKVQDHEAAH